LTTGDLSVTSIFLGTDDHNVRTTVDGGISMTTTRGTVLFGNIPDNPITGSSHFHIMKDSPDIVDLFFGDDDNYVKLPATQGVEVSANGSIWEFGTDGTTTFPENTIKNVADTSIKIGNPLVSGVVVATVDELIPPGDVWRLFINSNIYPDLGTTVHIGGTVTTAWGTPITATITDIQQDNNTDRWIILVAQDITAGFDAGPKTVSFAESYKTWSFGTDGDLTLPTTGDIVNGDGESFLKDIPQNYPTGYSSGFYALQASDRGRHILIDGSEGTSIQVPTDATEPMPIGSAIVLVIKPGMYNVFVGAEDYDAMVFHGAGVDSNGAFQIDAGNGGAMATLIKIGANEWMISGTGLAEYTGP
jgi:hypothetical protein